MRLSEAIRLGAMMHPQAFYHEYAVDTHGKVISTCALGAAAQAVGMPFFTMCKFDVDVVNEPVACPACTGSARVAGVVART